MALLREREERLERTYPTVEHVAQSQVGERSRSRSPAEPEADQSPRGLSVYEQQAAELALGGPCWWEDLPERWARHEARRRERFIDC